MPRTLPRQKLHKSPLVLVLAQVRFSPVLGMASYVGDLQSKLLDIGFARARQVMGMEMILSPGMQAPPAHVVRWDFVSDDERWGVFVSQGFITLATTDYDTFEEFAERLGRILRALVSSAPVRIFERIGLRYVDVVRLDEGQAFEEFVQPSLLGYRTTPAGGSVRRQTLARTESLLETSSGVLALRSLLSRGQTLPMDLHDLQLRTLKVDTSEPTLILDFDHFAILGESGVRLEVDELLEHTLNLHDALDVVFRASVTPLAMIRWQQELLT